MLDYFIILYLLYIYILIIICHFKQWKYIIMPINNNIISTTVYSIYYIGYLAIDK